MKKILAALLALAMLFSLAACGGGSGGETACSYNPGSENTPDGGGEGNGAWGKIDDALLNSMA